jgi:hypothetical protein
MLEEATNQLDSEKSSVEEKLKKELETKLELENQV